MKVRIQRFAALLMALILCVGLWAVPASAADQDSIAHKISTFWDVATRAVNPLYAIVAGFLDNKPPESATDADWQKAYDDYAKSLPSTGIDSDGYLYWQPSLDYGRFCPRYNYTTSSNRGWVYWGNPDKVDSYVPTAWSFDAIHGNGYNQFAMRATDTKFAIGGDRVETRYVDGCPIDGYYAIPSNPSYSGYYLNSRGERTNLDSVNGTYASASFYGKNASISYTLAWPSSFSHDSLSYFELRLYDMPVKVKPLSGLIDPAVDTTYGPGSRPGTLVGITYGYQDENGDIVVYTAQDSGMFNEVGGYLYNPITHETYQAESWFYDYENRRYDITLSGNQGKATLEYGDDGATIKIIDSNNVTNIYNYYYMVPDGGGEDPDPTPPPDTHTHDYKSVVTTEPSCVSAGLKTLTCSVCGDVKTEKIPATGHTYVVDRTVNTTYDQDGNITQQGYTIYKCSVCGNEYKDDTSTGPPDSGGSSGGGGILDKLGELLGSIFGGILSVLGGIITAILDALIGIVNGIAERLQTVVGALSMVFAEVPKMFSGFTDFLGSAFSFLPPEIVTILIFGILAVVLVAVLKMFLK